MTIDFHCPHCQKLLRTGDDKAGLAARCPQCAATLTVPVAAVREDQVAPSRGVPPGTGPTRPGSAQPHSATAPSEWHRPAPSYPVPSQYGYGPPPGGMPYYAPGQYLPPHRGAMLLTFAILGWAVCFIFGIMAWMMANTDLEEMRAGRMDPSGEGLTQAAKTVAMISAILGLISIAFMVLYVLFIALMIIVGAAGA
ncbi:MAG: hypothetical protein ACREJB_12880 [Planctomycetaceae bacterium]